MIANQRFALIYARIALGGGFVSAVAARFGLWRDRGPHPFAQFIRYTAEVNSFLPTTSSPLIAVATTIAESCSRLQLDTRRVNERDRSVTPAS